MKETVKKRKQTEKKEAEYKTAHTHQKVKLQPRNISESCQKIIEANSDVAKTKTKKIKREGERKEKRTHGQLVPVCLIFECVVR